MILSACLPVCLSVCLPAMHGAYSELQPPSTPKPDPRFAMIIVLVGTYQCTFHHVVTWAPEGLCNSQHHLYAPTRGGKRFAQQAKLGANKERTGPGQVLCCRCRCWCGLFQALTVDRRVSHQISALAKMRSCPCSPPG
ncbi:hypothetical protein BO70DRAFT_363158 [Aspergillus heteromorphus CBS 117.55]|uniref:Secreted protein n=1 Tax=Aspergillus heteromorphus CBS 117.55 TaxID=1448321 RepID=A0A317VY66_9EURO|nr:uncharacterized protein BO70DRAFT_363158 [Aspergillus heteromorphus CBS 117.55]PWY78271.1 hypothetical protein BO70DRAFT_363158 [Aspergillus heteromorphus CBS 117.55]